MNLKESYTYQNFLSRMIRECKNLLCNNTFTMTKTQVHNIKESDPNGKDKTVVSPSTARLDAKYKPMDVINLLVKLIEEKDAISTAIAKVKATTEIDIDKSMAMNKLRNEVIYVLDNLSKLEASETESNGTGYRLNETSGSQEKFNYVITNITTINFDRKDVRALVKKYTKINKELSDKKDLIELTVNVVFEPKYDIDSTIEELLEVVM